MNEWYTFQNTIAIALCAFDLLLYSYRHIIIHTYAIVFELTYNAHKCTFMSLEFWSTILEIRSWPSVVWLFFNTSKSYWSIFYQIKIDPLYPWYPMISILIYLDIWMNIPAEFINSCNSFLILTSFICYF